MTPRGIKTISRKVRAAVEEWAHECSAKIDIDLDNMRGACAVGSAMLHEIFWKHGIESTLHRGTYTVPNGKRWSPHCWVEVDDVLIDITATQFDLKKKIIFIKKDDALAKGYKSQIRAGKPHNYLTHLKFWRAWGITQRPTHGRMKEIRKKVLKSIAIPADKGSVAKRPLTKRGVKCPKS